MGQETSIAWCERTGESNHKLKFKDIEGTYSVSAPRKVHFEAGEDVIVDTNKNKIIYENEVYEISRVNITNPAKIEQTSSTKRVADLEKESRVLKERIRTLEKENELLKHDNKTQKDAIIHYENFSGIDAQYGLPPQRND